LSAASSNSRNLLVVEDDPGLQSQLKWCFEDYQVTVVGDREAAIGQVRRLEPPVVTLDLGLPPDPANASEGLATLQEIMAIAPGTKVIVVTGNDDRDNAVRAIGLGAYDFYQKPIDPEILALIVDRAYRLYALERENEQLSNTADATPLQGVIAASLEMTKVCRTVERVAPTDASVLFLGESGTGKEVLTRALHDLSRRSGNRLVAINCAAIPENLLESELFGYEKGAFTGANKQTIGKIEYADGGTLFLDEIGDLPQSLQAKLLRFLQERTIERLGGRQEIAVDVRVVCATHQDLAERIKTGDFREDLFYRISEITVSIPAIRARAGDALLLAQSFLRRYAKEQGRVIRGLSDDAIAAVQSHAWPGNARELENRMKRAVIMAEGTVVTAEDLELEGVKGESVPFNLRQVREEAEHQAVKRALIFSDHRVAQAAELLGVSRPTLYDLMEKHGLKG
jgi:two-component system NtrC family response regulator